MFGDYGTHGHELNEGDADELRVNHFYSQFVSSFSGMYILIYDINVLEQFDLDVILRVRTVYIHKFANDTFCMSTR